MGFPLIRIPPLLDTPFPLRRQSHQQLSPHLPEAIMRCSLLVLLTLVGCGRKAEPVAQAEPKPKTVLALMVAQSPAQNSEPPDVAPEPRPAIPSVETVKRMLHSATKFCGFDRTEAAEERL